MNDVGVCYNRAYWYFVRQFVILAELTAIRPNCANGPRAVGTVGVSIDVPITLRGSACIPSSDVDSGQVRMTQIVSCVDNTDFHVLCGGDRPECADIDHVDAVGCGLCSLESTVGSVRFVDLDLIKKERKERERERERVSLLCKR
jgi:hypothetical protein